MKSIDRDKMPDCGNRPLYIHQSLLESHAPGFFSRVSKAILVLIVAIPALLLAFLFLPVGLWVIGAIGIVVVRLIRHSNKRAIEQAVTAAMAERDDANLTNVSP